MCPWLMFTVQNSRLTLRHQVTMPSNVSTNWSMLSSGNAIEHLMERITRSDEEFSCVTSCNDERR